MIGAPVMRGGIPVMLNDGNLWTAFYPHVVVNTKDKTITLHHTIRDMDKFVDAHSQEMIKEFNKFWKQQQALIKAAAVKESIRTYAVDPTLQAALTTNLNEFTEQVFKPMYADLIAVAGKDQAKLIANAINKPLGFDITNPRIVDIINNEALTLAQGLSTQQTLSLRNVLNEAIEQGWGSVKTARFMEGAVPLSGRDSKALLNYHNRLLEQGGRTKAQIDAMTRTYQKKLMGRRAKTISRTELHRAKNQAQLEGTQQAIDAGYIKRAWKIWRTSLDDRVRDEHVALESEKVELNQTFSNGSMYPDDVNERCWIEEILEV